MAPIAVFTSVIGAGYYLNLVKQIFFFKDEYKKNPYITDLTSYAMPVSLLKQEENSSSSILQGQSGKAKQISFKPENIKLSGSFSFSISVITLLLVLFIYMPTE